MAPSTGYCTRNPKEWARNTKKCAPSQSSGTAPEQVFSSQNSQRCLQLPPGHPPLRTLQIKLLLCFQTVPDGRQRKKQADDEVSQKEHVRLYRSSCYAFLCGTQPCHYLLAPTSSSNAHSSHSFTYNSSEPKPSEAVREQGSRLPGDQIRIHNGIVSPPSLYNSALCTPPQASGSHRGVDENRVWATIDMAWWANHILLNASARSAPSQNSSWLRNSFIVSVHPGVPCWFTSWNLLNQLWKLFREVNDEVFWNTGSSRWHSD